MSSSGLLLSGASSLVGGTVGSSSEPVRHHSRSPAVRTRASSFSEDCAANDQSQAKDSTLGDFSDDFRAGGQWQPKDSMTLRSSSRKTSFPRFKGSGTDVSSLLQSTGTEVEHLLPAGSLREGLASPKATSRKWAIGSYPMSDHPYHVDIAGKPDGQQMLQGSSGISVPEVEGQKPAKAAFFDVDGTITRTNVVLAYFSVRITELSLLKRVLWIPWFLLTCVVYLVVDHFHRPTFNRIFYLSYKGRRAEGQKAAMAKLVFERYYRPRIMVEAAEQIKKLKERGYHIVLVTGALDFQIAPLARELGADFVFAAKLIEKNGRFTGELHNMGSSVSEKSDCVWDYAERFGVSLKDSMAFGDSIADIAMLEAVGRPCAVNPDARLKAIALQRRWTVLNWCALKSPVVAPMPA